jgi:outer membrane protein assembly factor BamB
MTVEQRLDQLEKRNKRLTVALTMMAVVVCAVVTMAATGDKIGDFDAVVARSIHVTNDAGDFVVGLGANDDGDGLVLTKSAKGKVLVTLSASASDNGGLVYVYNKTGENIVQMYADEYGNGVVYAGNRKGRGRTLQPGP